MKSAPIILFVYNRPRHTKAVLEALKRDPLAHESRLYVYSDGPKDPAAIAGVSEVRRLFSSLSGFESVSLVERETNLGLSRSVLTGVGEVLEKYSSAIVLEDDIEIVPGFLRFMNQALVTYVLDQRIFSVSGWSPKIKIPDDYPHGAFLSPRALCWGWGTWRNRWEKIDWELGNFKHILSDRSALRAFADGGEDLPDMLRHTLEGRIDSWAVKWAYGQSRLGMRSFVPIHSFVNNLGQDDSGTHSSSKHVLSSAQTAKAGEVIDLPSNLTVSPDIDRQIRRFYGYNWKGKIKRLLGLI